MISLMLALLTGPVPAAADQAVHATLQSCAMEGGRWVCRYAVPDIEIVPIPGSDIVTDAPAAILGAAPNVEAPSRGTLPSTTVTEPAGPPLAVPVDPGPVRPIDTGVLSEREARLVSRCADAGWMSLCLPDDRRAARSLRDKQDAYLAVRREVTRLLSEDHCYAAIKAALDGGYLALARETRDYCAAPAGGARSATAASSNAEADQTSAN
ncbi:hypothetical protein [Brevundimonas sp. SL161]|uniref:hypothetical protein n=1 Tax=Brevundimonas sp. SL161 TaxID=2804613 RepID=UPI003CF0CED6